MLVNGNDASWPDWGWSVAVGEGIGLVLLLLLLKKMLMTRMRHLDGWLWQNKIRIQVCLALSPLLPTPFSSPGACVPCSPRGSLDPIRYDSFSLGLHLAFDEYNRSQWNFSSTVSSSYTNDFVLGQKRYVCKDIDIYP